MVSPDEKQARNLAVVAHLSSFIGLLGIPFGNILGPLAVWLWKRNELPFVEDQAKEALNFQITMTLAMMVAGILILVLIGLPILLLLILADVVLTIMAAMKANKGEAYRYPFTLRLIS